MTTFVRTTADELGIPWTYWDLSTDFGVWDPATGRWHEPLRRALLGEDALSPPVPAAPPAGTRPR